MAEGVSLRPSDSGETIESLVARGKPPPKTGPDMDYLELHIRTGIESVREAIDSKPLLGIDRRELSRYASRVARIRMLGCPTVMELAESRQAYLERKKKLDTRFRKFYEDFLRGSSLGYKPFVPCGDHHLWFWDEEDKNAVQSTLQDCGLTSAVFLTFVADAVSELSSLDKIAEDLRMEAEQGLMYLSMMAAAFRRAAEDCEKIHLRSLNINHE